MNNKIKILYIAALIAALLAPSPLPLKTATKPTATATLRPPKLPTRTPTRITPTVSQTAIPTSLPTLVSTVLPSVTAAPTRIPPSSDVLPFPNAPACADHNNSVWHALWGAGCHYDHEHGQNPFTPEVAAAFASLGDLREMLGGVGIGHSNPSSPAENVAKHGGFKWQVTLDIPNVCNETFEGGTIATKKAVIQFHEFGRQDIEHEARQHSSAAMFEFCRVGGDPNDVGYMYIVQLQEYGQRITPYQGFILPYPDQFLPTWASPRGPYLTNECFGNPIPMPPGMSDLGTTSAVCRPSLAGHVSGNGNVNSIWSSKPTGRGERPDTSSLFILLFRLRDGYQLMDSSDLVHPFTWRWMCSRDGGLTYDASMPGCRWNNSTATVNEVAGDIPASWDGAAFDRDPRPGRVTADLFVTRFGDLNPSCTVAGGACYPLKLVSAFVGRYSSELQAAKVSNPTPQNTPERDIYFCNGSPCSETSPGAVPSGWIGNSN